MLTKCVQPGLLAIVLAQVCFRVVSQTIVVHKGGTVTIDCSLPLPWNITNFEWRGPPAANVWYYRGKSGQFNKILRGKLKRLSIAANNKSLILINANHNDSGEYKCLKDEITYGETLLQVRTLPEDPILLTPIKIDGHGLRAIANEPFTVSCVSYDGYPTPVVALYLGSITTQPLAQTNGTHLKHTFTPRRQDDGQQLVCRSYYPTTPDTIDSQTKNVTLYLYLNPLQAIVTQTAKVVRGDNVTVECTTTGSRPKANIMWRYRERIYVTDEKVTGDPATVVSTFRKRVAAADNGYVVFCIATNKETNIVLTGSTVLNVQFPVNQSTTSITGNGNIVANGANPLTLTCTTGSSNPASNITWRNGSDVINSNSPYIHTFGPNHGSVTSRMLRLQPNRYEHGNTISCSVSNGVLGMTDSKSVVLDLRYSPMVRVNSVITAPEGHSAVLKCEASSEPLANFTWKKGSLVLLSGMGTNNFNGLDYTINSLNRSHTGTYTCTADNNIPPYDSKETKLTVQFPPDPPYEINITVLDYQTVNVMWKSGFPNDLNQTFVIQLSTDNRSWKNVTFFEGKKKESHIQRINDLTGCQLYYMRIISINKIGESEASTVLQFTTKGKATDKDALRQSQVGSTFPIGVFVGGLVLGTLTALIVVSLLVFVKRRRAGSSFLGIRNTNRTSDTREHTIQLDGAYDNGNTDNAGMDAEDPSQGGQQYEELTATRDRGVYDQLLGTQTSGQPSTYENPELPQYQSLQRSDVNDVQTYEQMQQQELWPADYENLNSSA